MRYLIDTDWVIDHLHEVERVVQRMEELAPEGLGISIVTLAELYEGVFRSTDPDGNEKALDNFVEGVEVVNLDDGICRVFGRERGRLRIAGSMISDFDLLIASTALHHNLTLLSNNRRHFERVQGLEIISM